MEKVKYWVNRQIGLLTFHRRLLYSYTSIAVLVLILFATTLSWGITNVMRQQVLRSSQETLHQACISLEEYMRDVDTLMLNISSNETVQRYLSDRSPKTDYQAVTEIQHIRERFAGDVFTKKVNGISLYAFHQPVYPRYNSYSFNLEAGHTTRFGIYQDAGMEEEAWMDTAVQKRGGTFWMGPSYETTRRATEITANKMIVNTKNLSEGIGVVRVFVPMERFQSVFEDISLGLNGNVCMIAGTEVINAPQDISHEAILEEVATMQTSLHETKIAGKKYYLAMNALGATGWKLVGIIPADQLMMRYGFINQIIIMAFAVVVGFTVLFLARLSSSLSRPIGQVAASMRHFEEHPEFRFEEVDKRGDIGVLFRSFNRMMDRIAQLLQETNARAEHLRQAELRALQAQINPHFLYNTLDSIKSLAFTGAPQDIERMTTALSDFYRGTLNGGREMLTLRQEIALVKSYCAIIRYRSRVEFVLEVTIPDALMEVQIIKLLLQPLVENSIKHGFREMPGEGHILISGCLEGEYLLLEVRDNGCGAAIEYLNGVLNGEYQRRSEDSQSGYGIYSVYERIQLAYGADCGLQYVDHHGGVAARIRVRPAPLQKEAENEV